MLSVWCLPVLINIHLWMISNSQSTTCAQGVYNATVL